MRFMRARRSSSSSTSTSGVTSAEDDVCDMWDWTGRLESDCSGGDGVDAQPWMEYAEGVQWPHDAMRGYSHKERIVEGVGWAVAVMLRRAKEG